MDVASHGTVRSVCAPMPRSAHCNDLFDGQVQPRRTRRAPPEVERISRIEGSHPRDAILGGWAQGCAVLRTGEPCARGRPGARTSRGDAEAGSHAAGARVGAGIARSKARATSRTEGSGAVRSFEDTATGAGALARGGPPRAPH